MKRVLFGSTAVLLCLSFPPASAQQAISTPILTTDQNFRDLAGIAQIYGGTGFANTTAHDGVARTGVFYRSEALASPPLSAGDHAILSSLNIGLDIDLRTPNEINGAQSLMAPNAGPDWVPTGAAYLNVNIFGTPDPPSTGAVSNLTQALAYMKSTYQGFSTPAEAAAFGTVLKTLAQQPDAALFHCSGGKDRTGWTAMLLQTIAGVPLSVIKQDYLATNQYMAASINNILNQVPLADQVWVEALLGVREPYLVDGLQAVYDNWGSMENYLTQGLGLTQEDIYVLRAKMVRFLSLPGQNRMVGNAAAGAAFLAALQDSPLSGRYTTFNYYLQSAIDAGTLSGVETQVGAQVYADAVAYLSRQPLWVDWAIAPHASGRDLAAGKGRVWLAGLGGYFKSSGDAGTSSSTEQGAGAMMGATYRIDQRTSVHVGVGNLWGRVASAGATADLDTGLATFGARFGLSSLDSGVYVAARANAGWVGYHSKRTLAAGLGVAQGDGSGSLYGLRADIGNVVRAGALTVTPQIGLRFGHAGLGGFHETGSELALAVDGVSHSAVSMVADLDVGLDSQRVDAWTVTPSVSVGGEAALGNPRVESSANLYGFGVSQYAAYDSRFLGKLGLAVTAQRNALLVKAGVNGLLGKAAGAGVTAQVSVAYQF